MTVEGRSDSTYTAGRGVVVEGGGGGGVVEAAAGVDGRRSEHQRLYEDEHKKLKRKK